MIGTVMGIEKKNSKKGNDYLVFHLALENQSNMNVIGKTVVAEYVKEPPVDIKVNDKINLEYVRSGKFFDTTLTLSK